MLEVLNLRYSYCEAVTLSVKDVMSCSYQESGVVGVVVIWDMVIDKYF